MVTRHSWRTVSPPVPESKTPTGRESTEEDSRRTLAAMSRALLLAAAAVLLVPAPAAAFTKTNLTIPMDDSVRIAATYYVPDGASIGGWPTVMMLHGLGESRTDSDNAVGMSSNEMAELYVVPRGYAVLTFDARGHGESGGLVSVDGPREIKDVRALFDWLASRAAVNAERIGAFGYSYGGGAIWRAAAEGVPFAAIAVAATWTDLYQALAPQGLARSGVVLGFWQSIAARAAPEVDPIVRDLLAGRNLAAVHAFARERSTRGLLGRIRMPTFLIQGRRDFAFDLDQALSAYRRLRVARRLYVSDFGHPPSPKPRAELGHILPQARLWFDRFLKGMPNGIDKRPPVELAPDPWTGRTFQYRSLPTRRTLRLTFAGTSSTGWPHVVAVLSALTPQGKEIVVSAGGARTQLRGKARAITVRLISQVTAIPPRSRLRLTIAATSTAQSSGNLLYLSGVPRSARLDIGRAALSLPVLARPVSK